MSKRLSFIVPTAGFPQPILEQREHRERAQGGKRMLRDEIKATSDHLDPDHGLGLAVSLLASGDEEQRLWPKPRSQQGSA